MGKIEDIFHPFTVLPLHGTLKIYLQCWLLRLKFINIFSWVEFSLIRMYWRYTIIFSRHIEWSIFLLTDDAMVFKVKAASSVIFPRKITVQSLFIFIHYKIGGWLYLYSEATLITVNFPKKLRNLCKVLCKMIGRHFNC